MSSSSSNFNARPAVKLPRLNILPSNPEGSSVGRFPSWLHRSLPLGGELSETAAIIRSQNLHTVCEEAKCPNRFECWSRKTATFLVMGRSCTRSCGFCDIATSPTPPPLDDDEPKRVATTVRQLGLRHVVITMVARDDLADGGATHLAAVIKAIRQQQPEATVETLTSDFAGNINAWNIALDASPDIFNYNIETVRALTPRVRHRATYERTLELLAYAKTYHTNKYMLVKSGLMVGLGETVEEVHQTLGDLRQAGCDIVTIGQYLQPSFRKLLVKTFITPNQFDDYAAYGRSLGIPHMYCGPFIRSSYNADFIFKKIQ